MAKVLFVCRHNAGRSQMSRAFFETLGGGSHQGRSAGTTPATAVHPEVVAVMAELGLDLSFAQPTLLTEEMAQWADLVVTMGCGDQCPFLPGKRYLDWDLPDPAGQPLEQVRAIRDQVRLRVEELLRELGQAVV